MLEDVGREGEESWRDGKMEGTHIFRHLLLPISVPHLFLYFSRLLRGKAGYKWMRGRGVKRDGIGGGS